MDVREVLGRHQAALLALPNVTGVGIGERDGAEVLVVFVSRKVPESELSPAAVVPRRLGGVPTDVRTEIRVGEPERNRV